MANDPIERGHAWAVAVLNRVKDGGDAALDDINEALRLTGDVAEHVYAVADAESDALGMGKTQEQAWTHAAYLIGPDPDTQAVLAST